ncbi:MAG TPA: magnesium transporter [Tepidisphaeraceae bacterium]|jgi:magnesium transporter
MIGSLLQPEIEELIREKQWADIQQILGEMDPSDVAEILTDIPDEQDAAIFRLLKRDFAAQVFSYLPVDHQEALLRTLSNDQMRSVLAGMTPDDQARLLEELPHEVTRRLLETLSPDELRAARDLLGYPEETAGRYMTPRYVSLRPEMTAAEALEHVRRTGRQMETLGVLYVVDSAGVLISELRLGTLVMADPARRVVDIEDRPLVAIPAAAPRGEAVDLFKKYDRVALPVVDAQGHMLGIITADDVIDVLESETTEDIQKIGGAEALDAPYNEVGFWHMIRKRGGWLSALFLGETLTATAMGHFEHEIERAAVVALFVPLIISSGGNSGSQATTIIIRSLALKELRLRDWWRVFGKEMGTGLALGAFLGMIGFARILLWYYLGWAHYEGHPYLMAGTVWLSLIGVVTFGSTVGSMLPFLLRKAGLDPASASAPFVATLVDVTGLVIYFTVAMIVLRGTLL